MFKGLSPRAQKIISIFAQEEARKHNNDQILPEHLILAILKSGEGLGYAVIKQLKINPLALQLEIEKKIPKNPLPTYIYTDIPPSRRLSTMIDYAAVESRSLGQDYIGTEHLLLAAVKEEKSTVSQFFDVSGINFETVRKTVIQVLRTYGNSIGSNHKTLDSATNKQYSGRNSFVVSSNPFFSTAPQNQRSTPSVLKEFSRDLTQKAKEGSLDPVVGRTKEIDRIIQILSRRTKNNPVLVGEPGVGKTAIVEGLAQRIVSGDVPRNLLNKQILTLDLASVIAGTKYRGEFEERIKRIIKEIADNKNIVLFIDELHTIIGAGGAEGAMDASNIIKPALSRGEMQCIGATTIKEYRKHFEKDAALERRFQKVNVEEPSIEETKQILQGLRKRYEDFHGVSYEDDVIDSIVRYSSRFITERFLPDKAIDVMDEAGAMKKITQAVPPIELTELEEKINRLTSEKQQLVINQDYEKAAKVRDEVRELRNQLDIVRNYWQEKDESFSNKVTINDINSVLSSITGIPLDTIDSAETKKLLGMEAELHKTVIGQNEAVSTITSAIRRSRAGVSSGKRPLGSFIFLGPTGVGKTLLAKTLAKFLFGSEDSLVRIDMSDYMEKHNSSKLVGAPPGYVGYEEGGTLTEKIRRNPYSVVLLDEIEKAHSDIFNLLLQVLEEGELKDSLGHTVNFRNTVIIMTSNAGARQISNSNRMGFNRFDNEIIDYSDIKSNAMNELKKLMSPELINRIDDIIVFDSLSKEEVSRILEIQIAELADRLKEQGFVLNLKASAKNYLIEHGYEPLYGARPMRRLIQREIEDPVAYAIISGKTENMDEIVIDYKKDKIVISYRRKRVIKHTDETLEPVEELAK